jgi:MarR family transcriptional regulator, organic hydroperoxide resistance regulator
MQMATTADRGTMAAPADEAWTLLRTLFGLQRRRFLIAASELDLHPAQAGALMQLATPMPMNELASLLACDNSNVTGLIDRLEARDLVTRQPSPYDRRVKHLVLTDAGRELRARMLDRVGHPPAGFERLTAAENRQLRDLMRKVLADEG